MGAMPATQHMTAQEFLSLPDTDGLRSAELVVYALRSWPRSAEARPSQRDGFELPLAELFPE
jgi:hypothetical protein